MADGAGAASPFCARQTRRITSMWVPAVPRAVYVWCEPTLAAIKTGATRKASKFVRSIGRGFELDRARIDGMHSLASN